MGLLFEEKLGSKEIFDNKRWFKTSTCKLTVDGGNGFQEGEYSVLRGKLQEAGER